MADRATTDRETIEFTDGDIAAFWEHAGAWGNAVLDCLAPRYNMVAVTSRMSSTDRPADRSGGDTRFAGLAYGMADGGGGGSLALVAFPKAPNVLSPFEVSFELPCMSVRTGDKAAMAWLLETLGKSTEQLWHTRYVSDKDYEFLEEMLREDEPEGAIS